MSVPGTYKNGHKTTPGGIILPDAEQPTIQGYGTMGMVTQERGTYAQAFNAFQRQHMEMLYRTNGKTLTDIRMGVDVCGQWNSIVRRFLPDGGDWLWLMGDDHDWHPSLLPQLLAHNVDVVVPHVLRRNPPWQGVVNSHQDEDGWHVAAVLPEEGLTKIWSAGSAGMLIRRRVLEAIEDPWFTPAQDAVGLNEDLELCRKMREAGFDIYCDPAAPLGHISHYTVYPHWENGAWHVGHIYDQKQGHVFLRQTPEEVPA